MIHRKIATFAARQARAGWAAMATTQEKSRTERPGGLSGQDPMKRGELAEAGAKPGEAVAGAGGQPVWRALAWLGGVGLLVCLLLVESSSFGWGRSGVSSPLTLWRGNVGLWIAAIFPALAVARLVFQLRETPFVAMGRFVSPWAAWLWLLAALGGGWWAAGALWGRAATVSGKRWIVAGGEGFLESSSAIFAAVLLGLAALAAMGWVASKRCQLPVRAILGALFLLWVAGLVWWLIAALQVRDGQSLAGVRQLAWLPAAMLTLSAGWWLWGNLVQGLQAQTGTQAEKSAGSSAVNRINPHASRPQVRAGWLVAGILLLCGWLIGTLRYSLAAAPGGSLGVVDFVIPAVLALGGWLAAVAGLVVAGLAGAELVNQARNPRARVAAVGVVTAAALPWTVEWQVLEVEALILIMLGWCAVVSFAILLLFHARRAWAQRPPEGIKAAVWMGGLAASVLFLLLALVDRSLLGQSWWVAGAVVILCGVIWFNFRQREKRGGKARPSLLG